MKRTDYINWDEYFMGIALLTAMRSKDPSSQVGACIVSPENKILSLGGYSHKDMSVLHTVISSYEEGDIVHLILQVDPHAIINVLRTENFYGGFYRAPLD